MPNLRYTHRPTLASLLIVLSSHRILLCHGVWNIILCRRRRLLLRLSLLPRCWSDGVLILSAFATARARSFPTQYSPLPSARRAQPQAKRQITADIKTKTKEPYENKTSSGS
ncbi:hypothetical protein BD289DRAFT_218285 [Coniella lustricola]|uniref:Uncharacterized protein n=1 Tax=Coniella lustricola TaxID=2025994 RepID=A0A2T3ALI6_9PEZI|nr:hypothetical protein BD289DRAFT_218285 [Coniella lustricola]